MKFKFWYRHEEVETSVESTGITLDLFTVSKYIKKVADNEMVFNSSVYTEALISAVREALSEKGIKTNLLGRILYLQDREEGNTKFHFFFKSTSTGGWDFCEYEVFLSKTVVIPAHFEVDRSE